MRNLLLLFTILVKRIDFHQNLEISTLSLTLNVSRRIEKITFSGVSDLSQGTELK